MFGSIRSWRQLCAACEPLEYRRLLSGGALDTSFHFDGKNTLSVADASLVGTDVALQSDARVVVVVGSTSDGRAAVPHNRLRPWELPRTSETAKKLQ